MIIYRQLKTSQKKPSKGLDLNQFLAMWNGNTVW